MNLAEDQYANYLIQFLLEKWNNTPEGNEIKKMVKDNFVKMCEKKYSSFICELYIKIISPEEKVDLNKFLKNTNIRASNNHHAMKIIKNLENSTNNIKANYQVAKNRNNNKNNNKNNNGSYILNNNINYNNQNNMNSRYFGMNNNSNGNNNINNFNIPFNNNGAYGGF